MHAAALKSDGVRVSEFVGLIQQYLDRHGPRWAAFARNVGVASQTVSKWKTNPGMFPEPDHLKRVAEVTGVPYLIVLDAVLKDADYRDSTVDDLPTLKVRIARYARASKRGAEELREFLEDRAYPDDAVLESLRPEMTTDELNDVINKMIADADVHQYGNAKLFDREFLLDYLSDHLPAQWQDQQQSPSNVVRPDLWNQSPPPPGDEVTPAASAGHKDSDHEDDDGPLGGDGPET